MLVLIVRQNTWRINKWNDDDDGDDDDVDDDGGDDDGDDDDADDDDADVGGPRLEVQPHTKWRRQCAAHIYPQ